LTLLVSVIVEIMRFSGSRLFNCAWLNNAIKFSGTDNFIEGKSFI